MVTSCESPRLRPAIYHLLFTIHHLPVFYHRGERSLRPPPPKFRPPPRLPPNPRPPPRLPRSSRGLASFTVKLRPFKSLPLNSSIAFCPSSLEAISTKPKPRERPVSRSSTTVADSTVPICAKSCWRSSLEV